MRIQACRGWLLVLSLLLFTCPALPGCNQHGSLSDSVNVLFTRDGLKTVSLALELYKEDNGEYPESLDALLAKKEITNKKIIQDAWGRKYRYSRSQDGYTLFSMGSDGKPYTKDDIFPER